MKPDAEFSLSAVNQKRQNTGGMTTATAMDTGSDERALSVSQEGAQDRSSGMSEFILPFDPLRAVEALWKKWHICLACGLGLGVLLFLFAKFRIETHHTATARLVKQTLPDSFRASENGEAYRPTEIPVPILTSNIMRSRSLIERVSKLMDPPMEANTILAGLTVTTDRKTEVIGASFTSGVSKERAVEVVNCYADQVVKLTKELQGRDATEMSDFLKQQLARCDKDLAKLSDEMMRYAEEAHLLDADKEMSAYLSERGNFDLKYETLRLDHETLDLKLQAVERELSKASPIAAKLQSAQDDLAKMLLRYTEQNPTVLEQKDRIQILENEMKHASANQYTAPPQPGESQVAMSLYLQRVELLSQKKIFAEQLQKLDAIRNKLSEKLQQLPKKNLEYAQMRAKQQALDSTRQLLASRQREAELHAENPLGYYRMLQDAQVEDVVTDSRSSKKVLACIAGVAIGFFSLALWFIFRELSDSRVKTPADLRRVTRLPVLAALPAEIEGDRAAQDAWAFRTWTRLHSRLRRPGSGLVCGLLAEGESANSGMLASLLADAAGWRGAAALVVTSNPPPDRPSMPLKEALGSALMDASRWLSKGSGVVYLRTDKDWKWSASQRAQLIDALSVWSRHSQAVIFIELPPASQPETLLMAERLPQLLWVGASGEAPSASLGEMLTTYHHAGCKLLGALLNKAPKLQPAFLNTLARTAAFVMLAGSLNAQDAPKADEVQAPKAQPLATAAAAPAAAAESPKLDIFTLGAGDALYIEIFKQEGTIRKDVEIRPDGRINYLQAQDFPAAGLTIDELRANLTKELSQYYHRPFLIVNPIKFQSRKVYVLGKVVKKGMVNFDRPLTLLEAITEAGGLETGMFQQNTVELADLGRSFLSRRGERVKVDFEALFARGDMTQNVRLQPDDYIYLPSANNNEIYVLGSVQRQGTQGLLAHSSVGSAVTLAGGFTDKAFRSRVLVIRGSLEKPETLVVDMAAVLKGRKKDTRLQPNDIVFVADRPWARAEELLNMALTSFIQGATAGYTGAAIAPFITKPLINATRGNNQ